jgi:hypothetical protein
MKRLPAALYLNHDKPREASVRLEPEREEDERRSARYTTLDRFAIRERDKIGGQREPVCRFGGRLISSLELPMVWCVAEVCEDARRRRGAYDRSQEA